MFLIVDLRCSKELFLSDLPLASYEHIHNMINTNFPSGFRYRTFVRWLPNTHWIRSAFLKLKEKAWNDGIEEVDDGSGRHWRDRHRNPWQSGERSTQGCRWTDGFVVARFNRFITRTNGFDRLTVSNPVNLSTRIKPKKQRILTSLSSFYYLTFWVAYLHSFDLSLDLPILNGCFDTRCYPLRGYWTIKRSTFTFMFNKRFHLQLLCVSANWKVPRAPFYSYRWL